MGRKSNLEEKSNDDALQKAKTKIQGHKVRHRGKRKKRGRQVDLKQQTRKTCNLRCIKHEVQAPVAVAAALPAVQQ